MVTSFVNYYFIKLSFKKLFIIFLSYLIMHHKYKFRLKKLKEQPLNTFIGSEF